MILTTEIFPKSTIFEILTHPENFLHTFQQFSLTANRGKPIGDHTKETYVSSILAVFTYNSYLKEQYFDEYNQWTKIHEEIRKPIDIKYKSNTPTEKQQQAYVDFEEIVAIRDRLPAGSPQRLLLAMYTYIPPVRSDYYRTRIYDHLPQDKSDNDNIIVLDDKRKQYVLVLEKYKTAKVYGVKVIDLPNELVNEIKLSLKITPRDYLFISPSTQQQFDKDGSFNTWANRLLKKVLNKPTFSISMLRHIYISRRDLKLEEKSGLEQTEIATMMGHSVETQRKYMWHSWIKNLEKETNPTQS